MKRWIGRALVAAVRTRRQIRGPLREGWTVELETLSRVMHHYGKRSASVPVAWQRWAMNALVPPPPQHGPLRFEPTRLAGVPCEWITPRDAALDRTLVYLHGGGYSIGSIASHRPFIGQLARAAGLRALAVDYRLAPEHPFPAALEDARAVWRWLLDDGLDPARTVLAGDSAGGGLALSLLVDLRDRGAPMPAAAALLSPWVDLTLTSPSIDRNARFDYLARPVLEAYVVRYVGDMDRRHALVSPVFAELGGLPPLLIQAGEAEALVDEAVDLAERARAAGVPTVLQVYDDMIHAFTLFRGLPAAESAFEELNAFVLAHTT